MNQLTTTKPTVPTSLTPEEFGVWGVMEQEMHLRK
mgnify:CR=1 FL=1